MEVYLATRIPTPVYEGDDFVVYRARHDLFAIYERGEIECSAHCTRTLDEAIR